MLLYTQTQLAAATQTRKPQNPAKIDQQYKKVELAYVCTAFLTHALMKGLQSGIPSAGRQDVALFKTATTYISVGCWFFPILSIVKSRLNMLFLKPTEQSDDQAERLLPRTLKEGIINLASSCITVGLFVAASYCGKYVAKRTL